jgi:hypothetical protein
MYSIHALYLGVPVISEFHFLILYLRHSDDVLWTKHKKVWRRTYQSVRCHESEAIILIMRYGFTVLDARSVGRIRRSTGTPRLKLWTAGRTSKRAKTWNVHRPAGRGEIQISGLSVAPVTGLATINIRCAHLESKFYGSSNWNFTVVRT